MHSRRICLEWGRCCACYLLHAPYITMCDFFLDLQTNSDIVEIWREIFLYLNLIDFFILQVRMISLYRFGDILKISFGSGAHNLWAHMIRLPKTDFVCNQFTFYSWHGKHDIEIHHRKAKWVLPYQARFKIFSCLISKSSKNQELNKTKYQFQERSDNLKSHNLNFKQDPRI